MYDGSVNPVGDIVWGVLIAILVSPVIGYFFGIGLWAAMPQRLRNALLGSDETKE